MRLKSNHSVLIRTVIICSVCFMCLSMSVHAAMTNLTFDEYDKITQNFTPIDISSVCNSTYYDKLAGDGIYGWTDQGNGNDMSEFELVGENKLRGVDFLLTDPSNNESGNSCIILRGQNVVGYPVSVDIPIGDKNAAGVYFLHSCAWAVENVGYYVFHYSDGSEYTVTLHNNQDVFDWWGIHNSQVCQTAWTGENKATADGVSWYVFACENPYPEKKISSITAQTSGSESYLMLAGVTLTDQGPYLPSVAVEDKVDKTPDIQDWYGFKQTRPSDVEGGCIDVSEFIEKPAGKKGRLVIDKDGDFAFENGEKAHLWGGNIGASQNFPTTHYEAEQLAKDIAQSGINVLRFHMPDPQANMNGMSTYGYMLKMPNGTYSIQNSWNINDRAMDMVCYFMSELKKNGIYYLLDMSSMRMPPYENDNIIDYNQVQLGYRTGPLYFDKTIIEINDRRTFQVLNYYNPYTQTKVGNDTALGMIYLHNETGLLGTWFSGSEYYRNQLQKLFTEWLRERYKSTAELKAAWAPQDFEDETLKGLENSENLEDGSFRMWTTREMIDVYSRKRRADYLAFYENVQTKYYLDREKKIRDAGFDVLIGGSTDWIGSYGTEIETQGYSLSHLDILDRHAYYGGGAGGSSAFLKPGTQISSNVLPMLATPRTGYVSTASNGKVYKMPLTISEWNMSQTNTLNHEAFNMYSTMSSMYGWLPFLYEFGGSNGLRSYEQNDSLAATGAQFSMWNTRTDPIMSSLFAAASLIVLRGDVEKVDTGFWRRIGEKDYYNFENETEIVQYWQGSATDKDYYTPYGELSLIAQNGRMFDYKEYDDSKNNNDVLKLYNQAKETGIFVSWNKQILCDKNKLQFKFNTERTQAASGYIGGDKIELDDVIFNLDNKACTVYASSLSYSPIYNADKILITAAGGKWTQNAKTEGNVLATDNDRFAVGRWDVVEQITGNITIKTKDLLEVYSLDSSGHRKQKLKIEKTPEGYTQFTLSHGDDTMLYEISRLSKASEGRNANEHIEFKQHEIKPLFNDMSGYSKSDIDKVERLALLKYLNGTSENTFSPEDEITKGDFARMLVIAEQIKTKFDDNFTDVSENNINYDYIGSLKKYKIATGDENNNFYPDNSITWEEMITYYAKEQEEERLFAETPKISERKDSKSIDISKLENINDSSEEYQESLKKMIMWGYIDANNYQHTSQSKVSRIDAALLMYDILWK